MYIYVASLSGYNLNWATHSIPYEGRTIAEKEVPDSQQRVKGQVACEQAHEPVRGEHEGFHSMVLQVFLCSWTCPLQDPGQHGSVKQDSLLQRQTCSDS